MRHDAIVIGGSFAGLSAALQLARARRHVLVVDAGRPRNRFSQAAHGLLALDGSPGGTVLVTAREQLQRYPTASLMAGEAVKARAEKGGFVVQLAGGDSVEGRRLLLATGVVDLLPELPGLPERWGRTVLHCPYCHGYEIGGGSIGVLATGQQSLDQAMLIPDWGDVTLFTNRKLVRDARSLAMLTRRAIKLENVPVVGLEGAAPELTGVRLEDGRLVPVRALFIAAPTQLASPLAQQLGCAFEEGPSGPFIRTEGPKRTTVAGVYAAGDAARPNHNITFAAADGIGAAVGLHHSLIAEEIGTG